jgi:hypothetical protein
MPTCPASRTVTKLQAEFLAARSASPTQLSGVLPAGLAVVFYAQLCEEIGLLALAHMTRLGSEQVFFQVLDQPWLAIGPTPSLIVTS